MILGPSRPDTSSRPVREPDLPLLLRWRGQPHISRWWGATTSEPEAEKLADPRIAMWIGELQDRAFAFIQDYDPNARQDFPQDPEAGGRGLRHLTEGGLLALQPVGAL